MCRFVLNKIDAVKGEQVFEKLIINGICQFDEYEKEIKKNKVFVKELGQIYSLMNDVSNLKSLPRTKFHELSSKDKVKEYEFKTHNLRVYAIKKDNGKIIILGGYKNKQKKEINNFKAIKKSFLEAIL
jgi:hypothetical protein